MLKDRDVVISQIHSIIWNSSTPYQAAGWPPEMYDHVRYMMSNLCIAIIDSIYTEEELDVKAEGILLDKP